MQHIKQHVTHQTHITPSKTSITKCTISINQQKHTYPLIIRHTTATKSTRGNKYPHRKKTNPPQQIHIPTTNMPQHRTLHTTKTFLGTEITKANVVVGGRHQTKPKHVQRMTSYVACANSTPSDPHNYAAHGGQANHFYNWCPNSEYVNVAMMHD